MSEYELISDYKHNKKYKESFNELAKKVFELDFKEWYGRGCWNDNYVCYSYVDGEKVIANASINKMNVILNGKEYKAIQIGTVMTHPDYRSQGLAAKLMDYIVKKYEQECDFIYLFANDTVLDFYPKFGFERMQESRFSLRTSDLEEKISKKVTLRKLDINKQADFELMREFAISRAPISSVVGVKNNEHLLMFYFILAFQDSIYYNEEEDIIMIFEQEDNQLHIFDIISKNKVEIDTVLRCATLDYIETIHFHFTPGFDNKKIYSEFIEENDDVLFVLPLLEDKPKHFLFPLTSHA